MITLGSLFDGAGGFPYAGAMAGITPVWASEIEPFPIRVTTRRFPRMRHLGSITDMSGKTAEPVDVITFGSPCQDLSIAGRREGLDGERSGLFRQAIRIIREMREQTNGQKPKYIIWENVPGAFSNHDGEDFRTVLEEIVQIADGGVHIPRPENRKWPPAGEIMGDDYSLAWRTYDAQYWGVPQRRKRIYLVADFTGGCAGWVQFDRESLCGDFTQGSGEGQRAADAPAGDAGTPSRRIGADTWAIQGSMIDREPKNGPQGSGINENVCFTLNTRDRHAVVDKTLAFHITQDPITSERIAPCLSAGNSKNGQAVIGAIVPKATVYGISAKESNAWRSANPHSGCYEATATRTLDTHGGNPTCAQGGNIVVQKARVFENHSQDSRYRELGEVSETVAAKYGTGGNNMPIVIERRAYSIGRDYKTVREELAGTLTNSDVPEMVVQPYSIGNGQVHDLGLDEKAKALNCMHDQQAVILPQDEEGYPYRARRLTPLECCRLQGYPDGWSAGLDTPDPTEDEVEFWSAIFETHRQATDPYKKPKTKNQVRKWLQNPQTDSAEYKMWGNSLAIPCAFTVLAGVAEAIRERKEEAKSEDLLRNK